ncbi:hypothetical protein JM946_10110 [Steroidobacter sp. S1-65]|uniref:Phosphoglycerate mutase n=1 Tax=Steroidobacter gossypii TaxID=2805490 RepID=A0ABS1WVU8_9GAMM|nr:hypothetical protein [Steroidobacter gossypii]MBM0105106.1 hypothetical protein [Steroidobacter gossypii]
MLNTLTPSLTLIVPGLNPLRVEEERDPPRWPQLARLAGRGSVVRRQSHSGLDAVHAAVLDALQLRDADYPSGPVIRTAVEGAPASGFWLRAEPIHFAAGLDRLTTVPLRGAARMSAAERAALSPTLAEHLQGTGFELHDGAEGEWLLRSEPLQVQTVSPEFAATNPNEPILPRGQDAGGLRRLMTEMQMLLHEHAVNAQRQARGLPALNAIWVHGEGMLSDVKAKSLPAAWGDDVYLRGVYRLHDQPVNAKPVDAAELLKQVAGATLALIDAPMQATFETRWLAPLNRALLGGAIARLTLILDEWHVTADRAAMFKLWRRELPPAKWAAC